MKDDCINNLAKIYACAVIHSRVIQKCVLPKFIELCMPPCWCPSEEHRHGGRKVTETSVIEFCNRNETLLLYSSDILQLILFLEQELFNWQTLSNNSSFHLFLSLIGSPFECHATRKITNSNVLYYIMNNPVDLKRCKTSNH